jgi:hypothetical protein
MRVLTLVDIEEPVVPAQMQPTTSLTAPFEMHDSRQLGYVYHGSAVRKAVRSLPRGVDKTHTLTFAQLLHAAAWLFTGPAGGSAAENQQVIGVCVNDVAIVASFCFQPTLSEKDSRIHVSYGRTFFNGSQIQRLASYDQVADGILPRDLCYGKPELSKGIRPSLVGIDNARMSGVVNLRDDIATLAFRIQWTDLKDGSQRDILASPGSYLLGLGWHLNFCHCDHDRESPLENEGVIRVCRAGVFPQEPDRDRHGKILWPAEHIPSPNLPSPSGFTGCLALTKGCLEAEIAITCDARAGRTVVVQRECCIACACAQASMVGATLVMCT